MQHGNDESHSGRWLAPLAVLAALCSPGCTNDSGSDSDDGGSPSIGSGSGGSSNGNGTNNGGSDDGSGGSSPDDGPSAGADAGTEPSSAGGSGATSDEGPLYAMMVQVYGPDDRTVYVPVTDTLDFDSISLDEAREYPGVANLAAIGGKLLISDGSAPTITEFEIGGDLSWSEGRKVSFADYPLTDNANFYYQFIVDEHTAILPFEATKRIVWDPSQMKILDVLEGTMLESQDDSLLLEGGGNRNAVVFDDEFMQAFFYHDDDWFDYGTQSHIVVYDSQTLEEIDVIDVPCPGLSLATRDEDGNTYFGTWDLPSRSVLGEQPAPCIAKIGADHILESTIDPLDWTDGRFINNFRYIGNGKAVANVLHHEELGLDSAASFDLETLEESWSSGPHWKLWLFDVEAEGGAPIEGIDVALASGAQFAVLDGRTFLFVPFDDWGQTRVYELDDSGTASQRFDTVGDVFKWVKVH